MSPSVTIYHCCQRQLNISAIQILLKNSEANSVTYVNATHLSVCWTENIFGSGTVMTKNSGKTAGNPFPSWLFQSVYKSRKVSSSSNCYLNFSLSMAPGWCLVESLYPGRRLLRLWWNIISSKIRKIWRCDRLFSSCWQGDRCSLPLWRVHEIKLMYLAPRTHGLFIT